MLASRCFSSGATAIKIDRFPLFDIRFLKVSFIDQTGRYFGRRQALYLKAYYSVATEKILLTIVINIANAERARSNETVIDGMIKDIHQRPGLKQQIDKKEIFGQCPVYSFHR